MGEAQYVYPNVTETEQRGGLLDRWGPATALSCSVVEVPADRIKNRTEVERTGQEIGDFLTRSSIECLYRQDISLPADLRYSLHTDPAIPRVDRHGRRITPPLRWYDGAWAGEYTDMLLAVADRLGTPPYAIEIYPGDRKNTGSVLLRAMILLSGVFESAFGAAPLLLLVNRADQSISTGSQLRSFWTLLAATCPEIVDTAGVALNLRELHAAARGDLINDLEIIPAESLRGFHIRNGRELHEAAEIPWERVFVSIRALPREYLIKPDVYQRSRVESVIGFCRGMLHRAERELFPR
ncbi:hypothetical protein FGU65_02950 [Methanoculleus sp. FWC-SCC1]|uniref:Uncharacterized protein n=2 Tax=Methanoculleus frigidifontis TaxID=2584085 RepID=A0ABT8M7F0_9EURY|nr:hypothetical protein [Methanoculleus sp. FWC-SCC1]